MSFKNFRYVGMPWEHAFQLRDLLTDDDSQANTRRVATEMAARLRKFCPHEGTGVLPSGKATRGRNIADRLEALANSDICNASYFNVELDSFWDWADDCRILVK